MPKDYSLTIKVRNNWLLQRMRNCGIENGLQLSKKTGISYTIIRKLLNFETSALDKNGAWRPALVKIAETLGSLPSDLVPPQHYESALKKNNTEILMSEDEVKHLVHSGVQDALPADIKMIRDQTLITLEASIGRLSPVEQKIIKSCFGFNGDQVSLTDIGVEIGKSKGRVREIETRALLKLRCMLAGKPQSQWTRFRNFNGGREIISDLAS